VLHWIIAATSSDSSNPFQSVTDFFKSPTWHFITLLFYFLVAVPWIACAYWVFKDARRRIDDKIVIAVCVLAGIVFGPLGLIVYAIVRPPELLADRDERELEMQMMAQRLGEETRCSFCKTPVKDDYLVCPTCGRRLRSTCAHCGKPLEPNWRVCPYCEADVRAAPAALYDRL
jgi:succinate dehydrogenase hydrophobic anchor subunit/RNA polymerase subunit RPABC4/transcription elongation factor Spt4